MQVRLDKYSKYTCTCMHILSSSHSYDSCKFIVHSEVNSPKILNRSNGNYDKDKLLQYIIIHLDSYAH